MEIVTGFWNYVLIKSKFKNVRRPDKTARVGRKAGKPVPNLHREAFGPEFTSGIVLS